MASSKEQLQYILDLLPQSEVTYRSMMGEYLLYYRGKLIGGIYDDRFLLKPTKSVKAMLPDDAWQIPYEGAKAMLSADSLEDRELLQALLDAMYEELPSSKKKA